MSALRPVSRSEGLSARRWDALILGSGVAGLVAASRLSMAGHRVLVVEEDRAQSSFTGLREPFFLAGTRDKGLVDACLREVGLPLIERRRIEEQALTLQVVDRALRLDVGLPDVTASELVAWDLAKPDEAKGLVRALVEAAEAERRAMLASPLVRIGRRVTRHAPGAQGSHVRGLPAEAANPPEEAGLVLHALTRALSNLATGAPSPEARARLLGSLLSGGAGFESGPPWLSGLLHQRARGLRVDFRSLSGGFELVDNGGEPGVLTGDGHLLVGRMLILAAPGTAIACALPGDARPDFLACERVARRRLSLHFTCKTTALPEGMADRLILQPESGGSDGLEGATLTVHRDPEMPEAADLVARAVLPIDPRPTGGGDASDDPPAWPDLLVWEAALEARVRALLRFAGRKLTRRKTRRPVWDDDDWLEDPPPGHSWPAEIDLRASARRPVYRLDRGSIAGLGLEGDLLLGWRGGDALASEL